MADRRSAHQNLTRVGLTLAPQRRAGRRVVAVLLFVAAAFAAGIGAGELVRKRSAPAASVLPSGPAPELVQARQQLEQARLGLRVADARGQELERQIDALNQKLAESQDELTFFRKAREGRKH